MPQKFDLMTTVKFFKNNEFLLIKFQKLKLKKNTQKFSKLLKKRYFFKIMIKKKNYFLKNKIFIIKINV